MKTRVVFQEWMARGYRSSDDGDQVFMMCKDGLERLLRMTFYKGDEIEVEARVYFIRYVKRGNKKWPSKILSRISQVFFSLSELLDRKIEMGK